MSAFSLLDFLLLEYLDIAIEHLGFLLKSFGSTATYVIHMKAEVVGFTTLSLYIGHHG